MGVIVVRGVDFCQKYRGGKVTNSARDLESEMYEIGKVYCYKGRPISSHGHNFLLFCVCVCGGGGG